MVNAGNFFVKLALSVWVIFLIFVGLVVFPWREMDWGSLRFGYERSVTVNGTSETRTRNQIANFTAGVSISNDNREAAVSEMNKKMEDLVTALKNFGISSEDIQTASMSIYQNQDSYYDSTSGGYRTRPGAWYANNSVQVTLREVDRASALADLLSKSGANNVYGPNFGMDKADAETESELYEQAIADAREKAEAMATKLGARVGEAITIQEGMSYSPYPVPLMARDMAGGGGGAVVEPGSSTVVRTVTVTFELTN